MYMSVHDGTCLYTTVMSIEMSVAEVRANLSEVVNAAAVRGRITYITSRGRRVAAVVPLRTAEAADKSERDGTV